MRKTKDLLYNFAGRFKLVLLFIADACCAFAALGLFSFGIVSLPCALLGKTGMLTVTTDLAPAALLLICSGTLMLGIGMCLGMIPLITASYEAYRRFLKRAALRAEKDSDEEEGTA